LTERSEPRLIFESGAYTNFATPARIKNDKTIRRMRQPPGCRIARLTKNNCQVLLAGDKLTLLFCSPKQSSEIHQSNRFKNPKLALATICLIWTKAKKNYLLLNKPPKSERF
jgi:hypothetical protein